MSSTSSASQNFSVRSYKALLFGLVAFLLGVLSVLAPALYLLGDYLTREDFQEIKPVYYETNVADLIQIESAADVLAKRTHLTEFIWGTGELPSGLPTSVEEDYRDKRFADMQYLKEINRLTVEMEWGIQSIAYHFIPINGNGQLVIYHQGHDGGFIRGQEEIERFLEHGYAVLAFSMPLLGMNNQPLVDLERFGVMRLTMHDQLALLPLQKGHPVKFFLEPIASALNYAESYGYDAVHMTGISGGAWTTTLYAALDTRIARSYPVAGTRPFYLRSEPSSIDTWGDYESTVPELYNIANYVELYVMGAHGQGRHQYQIINQFDPCCFEGVVYRTYEDDIKERLVQLGDGQFDVFLDNSHVLHDISSAAMARILKDLN